MSTAAEPRFIDVDGIRVHCIVAGRGEPVVLLHGLGASHIAWRDNIGPLSRRYAVYALDLPGHGDSAKPPLTYALPEGSSFLSSLLDTLRLDRAHLVGNSLGGMIALQFALDHPERVTKLVLADPAGLGRRIVLFVRLSSLPLLGELLERPTLFGTRALLKVVFYD
ncbi:MAG: alpha/beta fold hydrolase, partial [Chloroflexi bacterium]|nr:alpha/beta fold hydrolase [Chloroflexota bacterium]